MAKLQWLKGCLLVLWACLRPCWRYRMAGPPVHGDPPGPCLHGPLVRAGGIGWPVRRSVGCHGTHKSTAENDKLIWPHCAGLIWPHPWGRLGVGGSLLSSCAAEPVAAAAGLDDVGVEGEPVHHGSS